MFLSKHASAHFILDIYQIESLAFRTSLCIMYPKVIKDLINIKNQSLGLRGFLLIRQRIRIRYLNKSTVLIIISKTLQAVLSTSHIYYLNLHKNLIKSCNCFRVIILVRSFQLLSLYSIM